MFSKYSHSKNEIDLIKEKKITKADKILLCWTNFRHKMPWLRNKTKIWNQQQNSEEISRLNDFLSNGCKINNFLWTVTLTGLKSGLMRILQPSCLQPTFVVPDYRAGYETNFLLWNLKALIYEHTLQFYITGILLTINIS